MKERESPRSGFYVLCLKLDMDPLFAKTKKLYVAQFYHIIIGYEVIGILFNKIRVAKTAKC